MPDYYTREADALNLHRPAEAVAATADRSATDPAAIAARQAQAETDRKEAERAQRRQVLRLNKLGAAAITTRREWITTTLLARKTAPKEAARFLAIATATDSYLLTENKGKETTAELLGVAPEQVYGTEAVTMIEAASGPRAQVLTLAFVLGAYEARTTKDAWRGHEYKNLQLARYLRFLVSVGYTLSEIEEVIAGDRKPEDVSTD